MKLVCNTHRRRVHAFSTPHRTQAGKKTPSNMVVVTVHRNDGTHCNATILRMGDFLWSPEQVVHSIAPVSKLTGITAKGKKQKRPRRIV